MLYEWLMIDLDSYPLYNIWFPKLKCKLQTRDIKRLTQHTCRQISLTNQTSVPIQTRSRPSRLSLRRLWLSRITCTNLKAAFHWKMRFHFSGSFSAVAIKMTSKTSRLINRSTLLSLLTPWPLLTIACSTVKRPWTEDWTIYRDEMPTRPVRHTSTQFSSTVPASRTTSDCCANLYIFLERCLS